MTGGAPSEAAHSVPGLAALLRASLDECPDAILFRDDARAATGRAFAAEVEGLAIRLRGYGLESGDRVLLAMATSIDSLALLFATLRAGLEPALVAAGTRAADLAAAAAIVDAVALAGPTRVGSLALGESYLSAAALCERVRLVATRGPDPIDGAADLADGAADEASDDLPFYEEAGSIITVAPAGLPLVAVAHLQVDLFAAALALVEEARITPAHPIVSTLMPATLAGLVAGPFAALIGASSLTLHGPFAAAPFLAACDANPGAHLVVPLAVAPLLAGAGMTGGSGSLILLSRHPAGVARAAPLAAERLVVDLDAFGNAAVTARRRLGGMAQPPSAPDSSWDAYPEPVAGHG